MCSKLFLALVATILSANVNFAFAGGTDCDSLMPFKECAEKYGGVADDTLQCAKERAAELNPCLMNQSV